MGRNWRLLLVATALCVAAGSCATEIAVDEASLGGAANRGAGIESTVEGDDIPEPVQLRQVLLTTVSLPAGLSTDQLNRTPTVYLTARAVSEWIPHDDAISSINELREHLGQVAVRDIEPGEQLRSSLFEQPDDEATIIAVVVAQTIEPGTTFIELAQNSGVYLVERNLPVSTVERGTAGSTSVYFEEPYSECVFVDGLAVGEQFPDLRWAVEFDVQSLGGKFDCP